MTELGLLPEEWTVVPLQKLISQKKVSLNPANFPDEIFEYYSIPNYQNSKKPSFEQGASILSQKILLNNGAVLFGKLNPRVEKVWKVESDTQHRKIGSTEWFPIFPDNEKVDSDFLYYVEWSKYVMPIAKTLVTGSTPSRQRVDPTSFYKIKIPLPPLPEQRAIANVLSTVQDAKEKTDAVITATKEFKRSLMKHLFTYGPVSVEEVENVPLKETEIGLVPEEWDVVMLGEVAKVKYGKAKTKDSGNIPVVGSGGIYSTTNKALVEYPTIVIGRKGTAGKVWLFLESCYPSDTTFYLKWKKDIDVSFLFNYMSLNPLSGEHAKTTLPSLQKPDLENLLIPYPSLPEQQRIASILSAVDEKIEKEETKKKALEDLFKTLLNILMTGKLRVNHLEV